MKILDMRGQPCPIPVVNAKKSLAEAETNGVTLLVDNIIAVQNLEKMARGTGCGFSYVQDGTAYRVDIAKGADADNAFAAPLQHPVTANMAKDNAGGQTYGQAACNKSACRLVALISSDAMGTGAQELGRLLVKGFIFSLTQLDPPPQAVIFLNSGVRLTVEGANTVPDLKEMEKKGTNIYICGTCANYYKLADSIAAGSITDMMAITNMLANASNIITI